VERSEVRVELSIHLSHSHHHHSLVIGTA
jgi:hypothetical protein